MTSAGTWSELQLIVLDHLVQVRPGRDIHVEHDDRNDSFIAGFVPGTNGQSGVNVQACSLTALVIPVV